ncbi:MAG: type II secretion system protein M [Ruminococcus sp.]|nr:type II secretion system protein M [Ruminococcus sp.]MDE7225324.1 type II secretion system protein M [Ruminococcus sp.]
MKLNYRDKVMLGALLALIIIVAGIFMLIKPVNEDIKSNKSHLAEVQKERDEVDSKIAEIAGLKDKIKKTYSDTTALTDDFVAYNSIYDTRKVDQYMQSFAEDSEVKVSVLSVGDLGTNTLDYYYFTPKIVGEELLTQSDVNGFQKAITDGEMAESKALEARTAEKVLQSQYTITVTAKDKDKIWKYMEAIENQPETILINSVSLANMEIKERPASRDDKEEEKDPTAQFVVTLYSIYEMDEPNVEMAN